MPSCDGIGGIMKLKAFPEENQSVQSRTRTFLVRSMITLLTFALGYSSIIIPCHLSFFSNAKKATSSVNIIPLDGPSAADLVRPSDPPQIFNRETKAWEEMKPFNPPAFTDAPKKLLPSPIPIKR